VEGDWDQVLVFTRTKLAASRLASWLDRHGVAATAIHSDRAQSDRTKALEAFKAGEIRVLVATDVAARGLDIDALPHVVNFELPWNPEDYVHRVGRTGRAGATGNAVSLVTIDEADLLRGVQRLLQRAIPWEVAEGFTPRQRDAQPLRAPRGASGSSAGGSRSRSSASSSGSRRRSGVA
ncbi:MAG: helicase-related protein, partial [Candidatus Limnocylindrales bacterium]